MPLLGLKTKRALLRLDTSLKDFCDLEISDIDLSLSLAENRKMVLDKADVIRQAVKLVTKDIADDPKKLKEANDKVNEILDAELEEVIELDLKPIKKKKIPKTLKPSILVHMLDLIE